LSHFTGQTEVTRSSTAASNQHSATVSLLVRRYIAVAPRFQQERQIDTHLHLAENKQTKSKSPQVHTCSIKDGSLDWTLGCKDKVRRANPRAEGCPSGKGKQQRMVLPVDLRSIDRDSFWYTPNMATELVRSPDSPRHADHLCVLVHGAQSPPYT
jgi:hypothetical protein